MELNLDTRIEDYLDGTLDLSESLQLERDLADPAVARAYQEALLIRTLMKSQVEVPDGLASTIGDMLAGNPSTTQASEVAAGPVRSVLGSMSWAWKGPALALQTNMQAPAGLESAKVGASAMLFALPPVDALRTQPERPKPAKRALWRRLLGR